MAASFTDSLGTIRFFFEEEATSVASCMFVPGMMIKPRDAQVRLIGPTTLDTVANGYGLVLNGIRPGDYLLVVEMTPYVPESLRRSIVAGDTLFATARLRKRGRRTVFGRVTDLPSRTSLCLAKVSIGNAAISTRTDRKGTYRLADVPRGPRWVVAAATGYLADSVRFSVAGGDSQRIDFALVDTVRPRRLFCSVIDAATDESLIQASVTATGTSVRAGPNREGTYRLRGVRWLPAAIQAVARGYQATSITPGRLLAESTKLVIPICRTGWSGVCGSVSGAKSSEPLVGASVEILAGGASIVGCAADKHGMFVFPGLKPGSYSIRCSYMGFHDQTHDVVVTADKATVIVVRLNPTHI